jgi:hypothetical protein
VHLDQEAVELDIQADRLRAQERAVRPRDNGLVRAGELGDVAAAGQRVDAWGQRDGLPVDPRFEPAARAVQADAVPGHAHRRGDGDRHEALARHGLHADLDLVAVVERAGHDVLARTLEREV